MRLRATFINNAVQVRLLYSINMHKSNRIQLLPWTCLPITNPNEVVYFEKPQAFVFLQFSSVFHSFSHVHNVHITGLWGGGLVPIWFGRSDESFGSAGGLCWSPRSSSTSAVRDFVEIESWPELVWLGFQRVWKATPVSDSITQCQYH